MNQGEQNKKSRFKEWLIKPAVRGCLTGGSALVIGILCAFIGITTDIARIILIAVIAVLAVLYFILVIIYGTIDSSYAQVMKQNKAYELTMSNFTSIFQQSSRNANKLIHEIIFDGKLNLNSWNFDLASELVCEKIYDLLCTLDEGDKNLGVGYIRLDESAEEEKDACVYMTAYIDKTRSLPTIHKEKRRLNDPRSYHDVQLFLRGSADTEILMNPEEISDAFVYSTPEKRKAGKIKYTQYIGIPVICVTDPKNKMVGLLEIICLGQKISHKKDTIERIVSNFLIPYAQLFLLLHKLEKALVAVPNNKLGGDQSEKKKHIPSLPQDILIDVSGKSRIEVIQAEEAQYLVELERLRAELDEICLAVKKSSPPSDNPIVTLTKSNFLDIVTSLAMRTKTRLQKGQEAI